MYEHSNISMKLAWAYRYKPWRRGGQGQSALLMPCLSGALEGRGWDKLRYLLSPPCPQQRTPRGQGSTDHQGGSVVMCHKAQGLTDHLSLLRIKILWKKIIKRKK